MNTKRIIRRFWKNIDSRNWNNVESMLHNDFVAEFPQSKEVFNAKTFLIMNQNYPGNWKLSVQQIIVESNSVVSEIRVETNEKVEIGISIIKLMDGKIINIREFWPEPFDIPKWRTLLLQY